MASSCVAQQGITHASFALPCYVNAAVSIYTANCTLNAGKNNRYIYIKNAVLSSRGDNRDLSASTLQPNQLICV